MIFPLLSNTQVFVVVFFVMTEQTPVVAIPSLQSRLELIKSIPVRKEPFELSSSDLKVSSPPVRKSEGGSRRGPSLEKLTVDDVGLAFLPYPHETVCIAYARYDCSCEKVRELDLRVLQWVFGTHWKPIQIKSILCCKNRSKEGNPMTSDRLYAHYHEARAAYTLPSVPLVNKRPVQHSDDRATQDQSKRARTLPSVSEALLEIERKEKILRQAKDAIQELQKAQDRVTSALSLLGE